MAASMNTQLLPEFDVNYSNIHIKPLKEENKPRVKVVSDSKNKSKKLNILTSILVAIPLTLYAAQTLIYSNIVDLQTNANKIQNNIVNVREDNYKLNVELAKIKELNKVEQFAINDLKMKPTKSGDINYLMLPQEVFEVKTIPDNSKKFKRGLKSIIGY